MHFIIPPLQIFSWLKQAGCRPPGVCNSKLQHFLEQSCYQQYIYANDIIYSRAAQGLLSAADSSKLFGNCYAPYICEKREYIYSDRSLYVREVLSSLGRRLSTTENESFIKGIVWVLDWPCSSSRDVECCGLAPKINKTLPFVTQKPKINDNWIMSDKKGTHMYKSFSLLWNTAEQGCVCVCVW